MGRNNPKEFVFVPQQRHMLYSKLNTAASCGSAMAADLMEGLKWSGQSEGTGLETRQKTPIPYNGDVDSPRML